MQPSQLFSNFLYSFAKVKLEMDSEIFKICNKILRSEQIILKDVENVDQRGPFLSSTIQLSLFLRGHGHAVEAFSLHGSKQVYDP